MFSARMAIGLPALLASAGAALAQAGNGGYVDYHPHMWGYDGWGMVFGPLMALVWIALIVGAVVLAVRWVGGGSGPGMAPGQGAHDEALRVLKARYAKGEIDTAEFNERKAALQD